jgi:hypothetical protein
MDGHSERESGFVGERIGPSTPFKPDVERQLRYKARSFSTWAVVAGLACLMALWGIGLLYAGLITFRYAHHIGAQEIPELLFICGLPCVLALISSRAAYLRYRDYLRCRAQAQKCKEDQRQTALREGRSWPPPPEE